jgi:hypothetical protein
MDDDQDGSESEAFSVCSSPLSTALDTAVLEASSHATDGFTSLPCAQDTGPKDVLKLLIVGDSAVRLLITLGARSAWWKAAEKTAH